MKKRSMVLFTAIVPLTLLLSACSGGSSDAGSGDTSGATGSEGVKIGYSSPAGSQPGEQQTGDAIAAAAKSLGWESQFVDANLSVDKQISDLQTMVQLNTDVISLWGLDDDALRGAYAQAKSQGALLVGLNSDVEELDGTVWWQTNLCEPDGPAEQTAKLIADEKPGGQVIIIGGPPVAALTQMTQCFSDAAEAAGLEIVNRTDNTNDDSASAANIVSDLLLKYPDVDAVWSYNDSSALGASSSIVQAGGTIYDGSNDGVIVTGVNGNSDAIDAVRQGRLTGTWDPNPPATGWAIAHAGQLLLDEKPADLVVESTFWSKANIEDYVAPEDREYDMDSIPITERSGK